MTFGVFIHRTDSIYDDSPAIQYQFPQTYLTRARQLIGDWVLYYEPTKVRNSRGYYAVARIANITDKPDGAGMFIAHIEAGTYLEFATPVAFRNDDRLLERGLLNDQGKISGRAQAAVRPISTEDFWRILDFGIEDTHRILPRDVVTSIDSHEDFNLGIAESPQVPFEIDITRDVEFVTRTSRDRNFRKLVLNSYDSRCAVSGLKFINGGGRAEVQAAHIMPVHENGPDSIHNGLPLSGTAHWMFDRGLISVSDDLEILISRHVNDLAGVNHVVNKSMRLVGPLSAINRPHPVYLDWHREHCFKQ